MSDSYVDIDSPLLENWPRNSSRRLLLAESFLNPEFKKLVSNRLVELKEQILNLNAGTDEELGKEMRRYKQELFVWEQLAETINVFAKELPHTQSNSKRK